MLKIDGVNGISASGLLKREVYDVVGLLKIDGASGTVVFQQLGPSKGRSMMLPACSKLMAPATFQKLGPSKGRSMMLLVCSKLMAAVVFSNWTPQRGGLWCCRCAQN